MWDPGAGDGAGSMPGTASEYSLAAQPWGLLMDGGGERGRKESRMSPNIFNSVALRSVQMAHGIYSLPSVSALDAGNPEKTSNTGYYENASEVCIFYTLKPPPGLTWWSRVKNLPCNTGDEGSVPGQGLN